MTVNPSEVMKNRIKAGKNSNSRSNAVPNMNMNPMLKSMEIKTAINAELAEGEKFSFTVIILSVLMRILPGNLRVNGFLFRDPHPQNYAQRSLKVCLGFNIKRHFASVRRNNSYLMRCLVIDEKT